MINADNTAAIQVWAAQELTRRGRDAAKWHLFTTSAAHDVFMFRNATKKEQVAVYQRPNGDREMGQVWGD